MHWWDETEARVQRTKTAATRAETLWQRLQGAGIDRDLAFLPAYDLAQLAGLCADLVKLVDGLLLMADGDRPGVRRQGLALMRWAHLAVHWTQSTAPAFNQMLNALDLDAADLAAREEMAAEGPQGLPEEQAKRDGGYRHWHLLYERLDLKLASLGLSEQVQRGLARLLARLYEESLITFRLVHQLERDANPRLRATARLLLQVNTAWHFDLGPHHLSHGELRPRGGGGLGLQTLLLLAFQDEQGLFSDYL